jgi:Uncharacterised nucleotidyltransferase
VKTSKRVVLPLPTLQVALRKITGTLAAELAAPTHSAPDWSEFEWLVARAVAAMHGISPLLSHTLRWRGRSGWTEFLEEQRAHTAKRHVRFAGLLQRIDQRARETGIAAVALKGTALHAMGLYAVGDRPMADIDLLVRPVDAERAVRMLESLGFREVSRSWKERIFNPADERAPGDLGEHADNNLKIELHERICEKLPWRITDATEFIFPTQPHAGLNNYPSKASLMIHLLLHAAGSMVFQTLRMLQLHDIALLSSQMTDSDWKEVLAHSSRGSRLWWAFPPLELASRYYPSWVPIHVVTALAGECSYLFERVAKHATLYDVSYSYPWVDAFPGIAWSQSVGEMVEYAANRVRPSAKHLIQRESTANSQAWANQGGWTRLSQSRRILRWITSRPARPVTMHAVAAALAQAQ